MFGDQPPRERSVARHGGVEHRLMFAGDVALHVGEGRGISAVAFRQLIQVEADPQKLR